MNRSHLNRLENTGLASCSKCFRGFHTDDVIATSTSKHYCYECATQINLVTGKVKHDLHNDKFVSDVEYHIRSIGKKLDINGDVCRLASLLVDTAIEKKNYVSKNKIGLACAAIFLACNIKKQFILFNTLPISIKTLQTNTSLLQKKLTTTDIYTLSKITHELFH